MGVVRYSQPLDMSALRVFLYEGYATVGCSQNDRLGMESDFIRDAFQSPLEMHNFQLV